MTLRETLINKQFEMIGVTFRLADIPEDQMILVGKKKVAWYDYYKFDTCEQYEEWKKFIVDALRGNMKEANMIDFQFGMVYKYKKESDEALLFTS